MVNAVRGNVGINPIKSQLFALAEVKGGASTVPSSDGSIIDTRIIIFVVVTMIWDEYNLEAEMGAEALGLRLDGHF